jgi:FkbM family methyltransferase
MKKKIVYIVPHLSTGGLPQYLVKQIESIKDDMDVYCVEWEDVTGGVLVIQRNKIVNLLGNKLITLREDKRELFRILDKLQPDVVHLQEIPELFLLADITDKLYSSNRKYAIVETSHDSGYNINNKVYLPDKFLMVSKFQVDKYKVLGVPTYLVEYPIENKVRTKTREQALKELGLDPEVKHVINVGLFTPRKNQAEIIEYARLLKNYKIQFHFIGNQAENFKFYWEPLMKDFPSNCKWWNERSDVDAFYEAADLFLFTSQGHETDRETMPLVIREALGWKVPSLIYNLPVYMNYFDKYSSIEYLTEDLQKNAHRIAEKLLHEPEEIHVPENIIYTMNGPESLNVLNYNGTLDDTIQKYGDGAGQYHATFVQKELEYMDVRVSPGDVFVDLGGNIGMSSLYANRNGAKEIHSFEPDPKMCDILAKNVPSATIHPFALSNKNEEIELYHWPHNPVNLGPRYKTSTITLKDVLRIVGKKINYLKIDIEGYEDVLFDDMTLEECAQIDKMMIEHHRHEKLNEFCIKLRKRGFNISYIARGYQSRIYARYTGNVSVLDCSLNTKEQKIYYTAVETLTGDIIVSVKDIDSREVIWQVHHTEVPAGISFWVLPTPKHIIDFETNNTFTGILLEFYLNGELLQSNEFRLRTTSTTTSSTKVVTNKVSTKDCIVIGTYPIHDVATQITKEAILHAKKFNIPIILTSHCPIPNELQELVDYCVVDKNNIMTYHTWYKRAWYDHLPFYADINLRAEGNHIYHGPAAYCNYYNGIMVADTLGFDNVYCWNYDVWITDENVITNMNSSLHSKQAVMRYIKAEDGDTLQTLCFGIKPAFFKKHFPRIQTEQEYNQWMKRVGSESNGLENMWYHTLKSQLNNIHLWSDEEYDKLLKENKMEICSMVEYYTVLPVENDPDHGVAWFSTNNIKDNRIVNLYINDVLVDTKVVDDTCQYYKLFKLRDTHTVKFDVIDPVNNKIIKNKVIRIDEQYLANNLNNNGIFRFNENR